MHLPEELLQSLEGISGFNREAFTRVHESGAQVTSIRINPLKSQQSHSLIGDLPFAIDERVLWSNYGYYLRQRPSFTFDPLFHAGCYYVQEASSMFIEHALKQSVDLSKRLRILDLSAAPGGKTTHIQSLVTKDSVLVSNEVIRNRSQILIDNVVKWGCDNVVVTRNDPRDFARLQNFFDVIVVDAPCSGSGLFRRDPEAIAEWSESSVQFCSRRQQRILADAWPALKTGGILVYSTCSYSWDENEKIIEWAETEFGAVTCELKIDAGWNITKSSSGYRFWPDKLKGEGFFIALIRKTDGSALATKHTKNNLESVRGKEAAIIQRWVKETDHEFLKNRGKVYAISPELRSDANFLSSTLAVIYFGTLVGEIMHETLVPAHSLAMSSLVADDIGRVELNPEQAIHYLKREELREISADRGWKLVTYKKYRLGWINVVPGRINNYYPKELRILKNLEGSP